MFYKLPKNSRLLRKSIIYFKQFNMWRKSELILSSGYFYFKSKEKFSQNKLRRTTKIIQEFDNEFKLYIQ